MNDLERDELMFLPSEEEREVFVIKDLSGLNWAFRKMSALQKKVKEIKQLAESEKQRIEDWEKKELYKYSDDISFFEYKISEYHARVLEENPKEKTIKTPYGTVKSITTKASPEKSNESELISYIKANGLDFVKTVTKENLQWSELKKTLKVLEVNGEQLVIDEYGEIVPGVIVKPSSTTFKLEVND